MKTDQVESRACLEPLDLALVEGVSKGKFLLGSVSVLQDQGEVFARSERLQAQDIDFVTGLNLVVVLRVGECESEHSLLLQVGLVNAGERPDDDGKTTQVAGFEGGMLARGTFTVVVVTDNNPLDTVVTVVSSNLRNTAKFTGELVLDLVRLAVFSVDCTN